MQICWTCRHYRVVRAPDDPTLRQMLDGPGENHCGFDASGGGALWPGGGFVDRWAPGRPPTDTCDRWAARFETSHRGGE